MTDDKTKRAMMAADLAERMARMLRYDDLDSAKDLLACIARILGGEQWPQDAYAHGLHVCLKTGKEIADAQAAIERGKWPSDSLPARLEEMRNDAEDGVNANEEGTPAYCEHRAAEETACIVLDLLGVKP